MRNCGLPVANCELISLSVYIIRDDLPIIFYNILGTSCRGYKECRTPPATNGRGYSIDRSTFFLKFFHQIVRYRFEKMYPRVSAIHAVIFIDIKHRIKMLSRILQRFD